MIVKKHGSSVAIFSQCEKYRYALRRVVTPGVAQAVNFIMLNPSTADEVKNDPTVERCCRRAKDWGYGSVWVTNLFAFRSTNPEALMRHAEPVGIDDDNDQAIMMHAKSASKVILAWGAHRAVGTRADAVLDLLERANVMLHALKVTKAGAPCHPLYLPYALEPQPFVRGTPT